MYTKYWELQVKPFELGCDPRFFYRAQEHQSLLSKLRYTIENRHGSALLCGDSGTGKSMITAMLRQGTTGDLGPFATLAMPQLGADEILCWLATEFEFRSKSGARSFGELIDRYILQRPQTERIPLLHYAFSSLEHFLTRNSQEHRHAVLVIDDAQQISDPAVYPLLKSLLSLNLEGRPVLSILMLANTKARAGEPQTSFVEDCMETVTELVPFDAGDTVAYVRARLAEAGATRDIFTSAGLDAIHFLTEGNPRKINRLCDLALLVGFVEGLTQIDEPVIEALNQELIAIA
ncbi:MAG: AAA family ATPase [Planctomycetia bacterium]|nr:AAA family ATPase [Planctomycetia bacterium]